MAATHKRFSGRDLYLDATASKDNKYNVLGGRIAISIVLLELLRGYGWNRAECQEFYKMYLDYIHQWEGTVEYRDALWEDVKQLEKDCGYSFETGDMDWDEDSIRRLFCPECEDKDSDKCDKCLKGRGYLWK